MWAQAALTALVNQRESIDVTFSRRCTHVVGRTSVPLAKRNGAQWPLPKIGPKGDSISRSTGSGLWRSGRWCWHRAPTSSRSHGIPMSTSSGTAIRSFPADRIESHDRAGHRRARIELDYEVSCHVETAADFHNALIAGVDEINHRVSAGSWPIGKTCRSIALKSRKQMRCSPHGAVLSS